jgi:ribosomal protein S18 acetylase RimI-like enzyme
MARRAGARRSRLQFFRAGGRSTSRQGPSLRGEVPGTSSAGAFLYATLEETSARIVFLAVLPEYRRWGICTALHQELKAHIPREIAFVGGYALLDSPVIPFLEKIGHLPGKQYIWMDRYA